MLSWLFLVVSKTIWVVLQLAALVIQNMTVNLLSSFHI